MFDTIDSLISKFTTLADKLEEKAQQHLGYGLEYEDIAATATNKAAFHHDEAARAASIATKIRNLVNA